MESVKIFETSREKEITSYNKIVDRNLLTNEQWSDETNRKLQRRPVAIFCKQPLELQKITREIKSLTVETNIKDYNNEIKEIQLIRKSIAEMTDCTNRIETEILNIKNAYGNSTQERDHTSCIRKTIYTYYNEIFNYILKLLRTTQTSIVATLQFATFKTIESNPEVKIEFHIQSREILE